ncbi:hypothetical protein B0A52_05623 [Exophiala mesophila]|uniref:Uncharacterized protein n=1 Tax=Exophiala mesophila TaxID=212818 RepID=A0A0D2A0J2_EXOME|nr:uncharacterized protein PV10_03849 [Exophiala mesophila]KIV92563.1 hypothetical protein PV10_03849 [Exophiala mesophila]RVX70290.1 hypothetical protein B0A52_05623 [Exophiala mesophila]
MENILSISSKGSEIPIAAILSPKVKQRLESLPLVPEQQTIIRSGGRADRLLGILRLLPSLQEDGEGSHVISELSCALRDWVDQIKGLPGACEKTVKWEVRPVLYDGMVTIKVKNWMIAEGLEDWYTEDEDARVDKTGEDMKGRLAAWVVFGDGSGYCILEQWRGKAIYFNLKDLEFDTNLLKWNDYE